MNPLSRARKALRLAQEKERGSLSYNDVLGVAYMRLLVARRAGKGVRLSEDEVEALFCMDSAISLAADNIEAEFVSEEEEES